MNIRERIEAFWAGECPDRIPYTIYQYEYNNFFDDPGWQPLFKKGLGVTWFINTTKEMAKGIRYSEKTTVANGIRLSRRTMHTALGDLFEIYQDGWKQKYFLETVEDYHIMVHAINSSTIQADYEPFFIKDKEIGEFGIPWVAMGRTPLQTILVDWAGVENFSFHLYDFKDAVFELYEALLQQFKEKACLIADGPGRYVSVLENFTSETLGPKRYLQYLLPVYKELFPIIQQSGKIIGTHYDGQLNSCKHLIASAPMDLIESLTPPPEGDMSLKEARKCWPEKLFWSNINIDVYDLPPSQLRDIILNRVAEAAPDGKRLAFEVSEQIPTNWRVSMETVLDILMETAR